MRRLRKLSTTVLVLGLIAGAVATTFSAFSSTTSNPGNSFAAGTVAIGDNDAGSAMFDLSGLKPGDSASRCVLVTYTGSLDATVRLYGTVSGALAPYLTLTVTRGTDSSPSFSSCTNFTPDAADHIGAGAGVIFSGTLAAYPSTYAAGIVDPVSGSPETWTTSESHTYRFTVTVQDDNGAQSASASATLTWEARNA